jgi:hypothetical protein
VATIETGRYSTLLRRFLLLKGATDVAGELSPEISPVFVLEDCRADWQFLKGEHLITCSTLVLAEVGLEPVIRIINPAGNTAIATMDTFWYSLGNAGGEMEIRESSTLAALPTLSPTHSRDSRYLSTEASSMVVSFDAVAPAGTVLWQGITSSTALQRPLHFPYVIAPGHGIDFGSTSQNQIMRLSVVWHERPVSALEL